MLVARSEGKLRELAGELGNPAVGCEFALHFANFVLRRGVKVTIRPGT